MFCKRCYADLEQATDARCPRCGRVFDRSQTRTYLARPFPSRLKVLIHTIVTIALAGLVSVAVAGVLAAMQMTYMNSGH